MCRLDFCNRIISRSEMENYSNEILELLIKSEEIGQQNMGLINENKVLKEEKNELKNLLILYKDLQKKELELLAKMGKEVENSYSRLRDHRRQLRILKIKKINQKKKKLRITGSINI